MHSVELLIDALNKYEGSYILVSHDRHFVANTANKIWEIVDGKIKEFKGTYNEYLAWKERMAAKQHTDQNQHSKNNKTKTPERQNQQPATHNQQPTTNTPQPTTSNPPISKELKKELQKKQKELSQAEQHLEEVRKRKEQLEQQLSDSTTYSDKEKFLQTEIDYKKIQSELIIAEQRFESLFEKVMELEE
jgi:ATP-binding cassette subfamily F protein 3